MGNLKKVISLKQASQISGYHQDYLSSLIRKNEIKGEKLGRNWVTTEEEVRGYMFKKETRNKNWAVKLFLYVTKINQTFVYSLLFLVLVSVGVYFYNKNFDKNLGFQARASDTQDQNTNQSISQSTGRLEEPQISEF